MSREQLPVHEILVLIAYMRKKSTLIVNADISIDASGVGFNLSLHLHAYFVYASSEGPVILYIFAGLPLP